jgi:hypothetical protein
MLLTHLMMLVFGWFGSSGSMKMLRSLIVLFAIICVGVMAQETVSTHQPATPSVAPVVCNGTSPYPILP